MKQFFLVVLSLISISVYSQDTIKHRIETRIVSSRVPFDTNRVAYDENGKALHYYQYQKLINTGDYTTRLQIPGDVTSNFILKKLTDQEKIQRFSQVKQLLTIKSPLLQEGSTLNITPLTEAIPRSEMDNKVIVMIYWYADCPPCTEAFGTLNEFLKQIHNPENLMLIAITRDSEAKARAKLLEKPLLYSKLICDGGGITKAYQLDAFPSYVVTDKDHVIRFSCTGQMSATLPALKEAVKAVLFQ